MAGARLVTEPSAAAAADLGDRDAAMKDLARAIAATPPELMATWREETAAWERAELTDLRDG
jgi:hypothetical protein